MAAQKGNVLAELAPTWTEDSASSSKERGMKVCYCDESGTGDEPVAVMVGIIVDTQRMHITKVDWRGLLAELSTLADREVSELHTRDFYAGNGIWRGIQGHQRAAVISRIFGWLGECKHHVVYASVCKKSYFDQYGLQRIPDELNTIWRFLGFHLILAMQKRYQKDESNKGNTIFIFDNEEREQMRFTDLILRPPDWSDAYYERKRKQEQLDQIVDVPYFGDSKDVSLIQVADVASYFLRRYAEIKEDLVGARYPDEEQRVTEWAHLLVERSIGGSMIYPKVRRDSAADLFYRNASVSIRDL